MNVAIVKQHTRFSWSYSQLTDYETCPLRWYHKSIAKDVKEEESSFTRDGHALHDAFNARARGEPLRFPYTHHEPIFTRLDSRRGDHFPEQNLAIKRDFTPCAWMARETWFRGKIDFLKLNGFFATIIDWKSGKPKEDLTQLKLMAALMFAHNPMIERISTALAYVNHEIWKTATFDRSDLTQIWAEIMPRVNAMERAKLFEKFPPTPSGLCKRFCPVTSCQYHGKGSGDTEWT